MVTAGRSEFSIRVNRMRTSRSPSWPVGAWPRRVITQRRLAPTSRHHHLLDPRTGHSPTELSSVSIAAGSAMQADALSTAVFVMGAAAGFDLARETPGVDAMFVLKDGSVRLTPNFPLSA